MNMGDPIQKTGSKWVQWLIILALVLVAIFLYRHYQLGQYLNLDALKRSRDALNAHYQASPVVFLSLFFMVYVLSTALSIPGAATILTIAAGAMFGVLVGTVLVSFASTIGATLAFLTARYLLRDFVQAKFGDRLTAINDGMRRDGALYMLTLRLLPIFPFFAVNLLAGLTSISTARYFVSSQIGMLAGTLVYVNAGTQLAAISKVSDILSPGLLFGFVLLGIFPFIAKGIVSLLKARKVYAKWQKPAKFDRNMVVIGGGSGGLVSALIAAAVKSKVTLVEGHKMGGDCLNFGCVPSKALIKSATVAHQMKHGAKYGLSNTEPTFSFKAAMARVHHIIAEIAPHDSVERFTGLGVEVLQGHAKIVDPWTVDVTLHDGTLQRLTTKSIVIATGARPFVPPLPGIEDIGYVTSDTLWDEFATLDEIPKRLVVLGGGPIGCELAQCFQRLGSQVIQIEMAPRIMIREDEEVSELARKSLEADGVEVLTAHKALRFERQGDVKTIIVEHRGKEIRIAFDALLCAVGRSARLTGFGLEELEVATDRVVTTNEYLQTNYPNIFAVGDVAGPYQFTHTAAHQAWYAAVNALFGVVKKFKVDYRVIPWTTFIDPEVARVGLNEQEAKEKNIAYEVTKFDIAELDRAIADSAAVGFVKVLTVPGKDKILGVTIVGAHAGDLLAEYVMAMKHGLGLNKVLGTIHTYPTMAEANKYAAGEWKKAHAPKGLLVWVGRFHDWRRG